MSSEVPSRPAAARGGRGATRGGRGGFGGRGTTRARDRTNGDAKLQDDSLAGVEDQGEIGELKKLYSAKTSLIKEMFPDWSDVDILFALRETEGDEHLTVTRIAEGTISQWDEVSKPKKERTKPKTKEPTPSNAANAAAAPARTARSGGAGPDKSRGRSSARPAERGGRAARGRSAAPTNGATRPEKNPLSVPTSESKAWDSQNTVDESPAPSDPTPTSAAHDAPPSASAAAGPKTWASMLRQSTAPPPPKVVPKPKQVPAAQTTDPSTELEPPVPESAPVVAEPAEEEETDTPVASQATVPEVALPAVPVPEIALAPSQDQLTESNLEQVVDTSHPPGTDTNHSEAADSWDPSTAALVGSGTPISASQQQHQQQLGVSKALGSGYVASAIKATAAPRTPSYSRRVLDQEEAVRMPGNREVDRAALQFGALSFNGAVEEDNIDGAREEPETRAQHPDDSPAAHPRASLPPVSAAVPDAFAGASVPSAPQQPETAASQAQPAAVLTSQPYGRYGQTVSQDTPFGQKPYDAFGQAQPSANAQYDGFQGLPAASQPQAQQTTPAAAAAAAYSTAPTEYSQYFTSEAQSRMPYNYYNQAAYGQQLGQGHQDGAQNQRSYSGYPLGESLNQYPQSNTSRFGGAAAVAATAAADAQNSGSTTPNPPAPGQQQPQVQQQQAGVPGSQAQQHAQQHQGSQYQAYNQQHPYYTSPYYSQYMQYNSFGQGNYNGGPYSKGGYGGGHHPYGMSPQSQYDPSATQAPGFGGASSLHRGADSSALGAAGLGEYGRVAGANQTVGQQTSFGTGHDNAFGRGGAAAAAYQAQGYGGQQVGAAQQAGADDLKPYGEAKGASGPSPSLARPGSAANTPSAQTGLPQSAQATGGQPGYGGYPSHLQGLHGGGGGSGGNQSIAGSAYGMGGAGASQNHGGNNPYGQYGGGHGGHSGHGGQGQQGFGNSNYYANHQQQQQRGWGGNYH